MPIREESNESLQNREEKTRITPLESSKIAKSLTVQNINALIDQKNLIFNTINAL